MKKRILSLLAAAVICMTMSACTYSTADKEEPAGDGQETVSAAETDEADTQGDQAAAAGTTAGAAAQDLIEDPVRDLFYAIADLPSGTAGSGMKALTVEKQILGNCILNGYDDYENTRALCSGGLYTLDHNRLVHFPGNWFYVRDDLDRIMEDYEGQRARFEDIDATEEMDQLMSMSEAGLYWSTFRMAMNTAVYKKLAEEAALAEIVPSYAEGTVQIPAATVAMTEENEGVIKILASMDCYIFNIVGDTLVLQSGGNNPGLAIYSPDDTGVYKLDSVYTTMTEDPAELEPIAEQFDNLSVEEISENLYGITEEQRNAAMKEAIRSYALEHMDQGLLFYQFPDGDKQDIY